MSSGKDRHNYADGVDDILNALSKTTRGPAQTREGLQQLLHIVAAADRHTKTHTSRARKSNLSRLLAAWDKDGLDGLGTEAQTWINHMNKKNSKKKKRREQ